MPMIIFNLEEKKRSSVLLNNIHLGELPPESRFEKQKENWYFNNGGCRYNGPFAYLSGLYIALDKEH